MLITVFKKLNSVALNIFIRKNKAKIKARTSKNPVISKDDEWLNEEY